MTPPVPSYGRDAAGIVESGSVQELRDLASGETLDVTFQVLLAERCVRAWETLRRIHPLSSILCDIRPVAKMLVQRADLATEALEVLTAHLDTSLLLLAEAPVVTPHHQERILTGHPDAVVGLARRVDLAPGVAGRLLRDSHQDYEVRTEVQEALAQNPALTPAHQLALLGAGADVHHALAQNPCLDAHVAELLLKSHPAVLRSLGGNEGVPFDLVSGLAEYSLPFVREGVACRGDLPSEVASSFLPLLDSNPHSLVRRTRSSLLLGRLVDLSLTDVRLASALVTNPHLPLRDATRLVATHGLPVATVLATRNPLDAHAQEYLLELPHPEVHYQLALSPDLLPRILHQLVWSKDRHVQKIVARDPRLHWGEDLPACFVDATDPVFAKRLRSLRDVDEETWAALYPTWEGSLGDLAEACRLVLPVSANASDKGTLAP